MITGGLKGNPLSIVWGLVSVAISIIIQIGFTKITLDLYDKKPLNFSNLYTQYPLALRYFGASILYGLIVGVGLIFLIIPGIYFAIKYQFYSYLIIDKNVGLMDSIKKSGTMTEGVKMNLFIFSLALIGINILGALALGVGLFVSIPITVMATVYVYRKLL